MNANIFPRAKNYYITTTFIREGSYYIIMFREGSVITDFQNSYYHTHNVHFHTQQIDLNPNPGQNKLFQSVVLPVSLFLLRTP